MAFKTRWLGPNASISGLVAEYIVAIDVTRVRFPADATHVVLSSFAVATLTGVWNFKLAMTRDTATGQAWKCSRDPMGSAQRCSGRLRVALLRQPLIRPWKKHPGKTRNCNPRFRKQLPCALGRRATKTFTSTNRRSTHVATIAGVLCSRRGQRCFGQTSRSASV